MGSKVFSYVSEKEMLQGWRDFVKEVDPDIITGFNIINFDFPYIIERADFLKDSSFPSFSRVKNTLSKIKSTTFSSSAFGTRDSKEINMEGRI